MGMAVTYTPVARRNLMALDATVTARIRDAVHGYARHPTAFASHVDTLARRAGQRLRVDSHSVLFNIEGAGADRLVVQTIVQTPHDR
jgi:hypothetical protein